MSEPTTDAHAPGKSHTTATTYSYYDILHIAPETKWNSLSKDEVKTAYRRALLVHHPDKLPSIPNGTSLDESRKPSETPTATPKYSIDEIIAAYQVLSHATKRAAYDEALLKRNEKDLHGQSGTHIGVETYDLEDMVYDEDREMWSRGCRCGDDGGYTVTVQDLDKESQHGEIYVGCRGCSLFIKVVFAVEED